MDANGNLYGTTGNGGADQGGTVFEIIKGTGTITTLATFNFFSQGNSSKAPVTLDAQGNLYGTTYAGGGANLGTVWELAKGSNTITPLALFTGRTEPIPSAASR